MVSSGRLESGGRRETYTPVAPVGDADGLDDEDDNLAEEDEKEEEEADRAVGPETGEQEIQSEGSLMLRS